MMQPQSDQYPDMQGEAQDRVYPVGKIFFCARPRVRGGVCV